MSDSKISSILLYVVAGISLLVMLFFYVAPNSVDIEELDARVLALTTNDIMLPQADQAVVDTTATDSLSAMVADTSMVAEVDSAAAMEAATDYEMPTAEVTPSEVNLRDHLTGWELMVYKRTDYALGWAYILFIIAAIAALIFPVISIVTEVKAMIRFAAILGGTAVLILFSYFVLSSGTTIEIMGYTGTENSNPSVLRWVGTGIYLTYFLFGMAILSILYSEVVKLFK
ncbi:MAG: hypothetical protein PF450_00615 [Bacteroidales bacterium]|jgi:hypothetical protein|nr:hypothetical protein [Bacteroidales bacterium]